MDLRGGHMCSSYGSGEKTGGHAAASSATYYIIIIIIFLFLFFIAVALPFANRVNRNAHNHCKNFTTPSSSSSTLINLSLVSLMVCPRGKSPARRLGELSPPENNVPNTSDAAHPSTFGLETRTNTKCKSSPRRPLRPDKTLLPIEAINQCVHCGFSDNGLL